MKYYLGMSIPIIGIVCVLIGMFWYPTTVRGKLDRYMQKQADLGYFSGSVLVAHKGEIILQKGYGFANYELMVKNKPETKFNIGSITKSFTGVAIMQLQEKGLVSTDDMLAKYLPNYPNADKISLHHLLTHTSGIPEFFAGDYLPRKGLASDVAQTIKEFQNRALDFEPGAQFNYSNSNYILLTYIIEKLSGKSYDAYIKEHILDPLAMNNSGYAWHKNILPQRASGYTFNNNTLQNADYIDMSIPSGSGSMYSTVQDLYLYDRALYTEKILRSDTIQNMITLCEPMVKGGPGSYCHGWYAFSGEHTITGHNGEIDGFCSILHRYPADDVAIILLCNFDQASLGQLGQIAQDIQAIIFNQPYVIPQAPEVIAINPDEYVDYMGKYQDGETKADVFVRDGTLFAHFIIDVFDRNYELLPVAPAQFMVKGLAMEITFVTNAKDGSTKLQYTSGTRQGELNKK